jgi:uncharacterized protein YoxC
VPRFEHVPVHDKDVLAALRRIEKLLKRSIEGIATMATDLSALANEVEGLPDAVSAVERVVDELASQLENAGGNQAEIDAITEQLRQHKTRLAEAIVANTPADPDAPRPDQTLPGDLPSR